MKGKFCILICYVFLIHTSPMWGQSSKVGWSAFDMGFAASASFNTVTRSIVGQNFPGATRTGNSMVTGGLLADTLFRSFVVSVRDDEDVPTAFELNQNYPNPFNPSTTIQYSIPVRSHVVLKIYNVIGQEVAMIVNEQQEVGSKSVTFASDRLASGIYFYRFNAGEFSKTRKMILLR